MENHLKKMPPSTFTSAILVLVALLFVTIRTLAATR